MNEEWGAQFVINNIREVCTNADEVVRNIKNTFPSETTENLARRARVSFQTVQRWIGSGRADGKALRRLLEAYPASRKDTHHVYLNKATPKQLYDRCAALGWDAVIQAGREK